MAQHDDQGDSREPALSLEELFKELPTTTTIKEGAIIIGWSRPGVGWGEVTLWVDKEGRWQIDDETMGPVFVKSVLNALVDLWWSREAPTRTIPPQK